MANYVKNIVVRFKDFTEEQFLQFDAVMENINTKTRRRCYLDERTRVGMAVITPKDKSDVLDRRIFVRPAM